MQASREQHQRVAELSREVALLVDAYGAVTWADERSRRLLGDLVGRPLASIATPGTEAKVGRLVAGVLAAAVPRFEVSLVSNGRPATFAFRGEPCDGGAVLVGLHVSDEEDATYASVAATMSEIAELHRASERNRRDLADSHRALLTMNAELDDKSDELRRASDVKSRVVSNVSHEFRTPINSILGITQILLDRLDGDLTAEQETQVRFVRSSAQALSELVTDLLDLSRIEAGRYDLRLGEVLATDVLSSVRGTMAVMPRPEAVEFVVEEPVGIPAIFTDVGKLAQILRNLVSNALKFTEKGEVRVRVDLTASGRVLFLVSDTGIGIAHDDLERVFDEFSQLDSEVQRRVRGTGLGLFISRRIAEVLGGTLTVESELGKGSTFTVDLPLVHAEAAAVDAIVEKSAAIDKTKVQVLVVEDNRQTLFVYEKYLSNAGFQVMPARSVDEARKTLERVRPGAIVLDVVLEGEATWGFLRELKENVETRDIPVMVVTVIDRAQKARALGADEFWLKPIDGDRLIRKLDGLARRGRVAHVLVVDDDAAARYLVRRLLGNAPYAVIEASSAAEAVKQAREHRPEVILLDFVLGTETAFDVIDDLKADASTRNIPIILTTAKSLDDVERSRLERETAAIVTKESLTREVALARIREALEASGIAPGQARLA